MNLFLLGVGSLFVLLSIKVLFRKKQERKDYQVGT